MAGFRASARTVDLLGRQQIAGIPTALSELFKNAHDAYADRVEADFFRQNELLVLRDDGIGMSRDDFESRWLTLGTDSKVGASRGLKPPHTSGTRVRPVLGEKGIGRLAIASIGSQVLVLTRPKDGTLTVALICWQLFEIPGLNLDQIVIPLREHPGGYLPDKADLAEMTGEIKTHVAALELDEDESAGLLADLERLTFDPAVLLNNLPGPSLQGEGHGTQFIIAPTREQLAADIDGDPDEETAPPLVQTLIGLSNTMTPGAGDPALTTAFRDRRSGDNVVDLIGTNQFFTPDEFTAADHHIEGWFDENGYFRGTLNIYGEGPRPYELGPPGGDKGVVDCGPFRITLAYVQGEPTDSRIDLAMYGQITEKLKAIGGLYIYREGIRVQPYGRPEYDFLQFEQRRSRNAGRYFFSYRRMFGVIELTSDANRGLQEKAGREGFIENKALREMRKILIHLFMQIAADYFGERAKADTWREAKVEVNRRNTLKAEREKHATATRARFRVVVSDLLEALDNNEPQQRATAVVQSLEARLQPLVLDAADADTFLEEELRVQQEVGQLRRKFSATPPKGVGLDRDLTHDWQDLEAKIDALKSSVWDPTLQRAADAVGNAMTSAEAGPDRRRRLVRFVRRAADEATGETVTAAAEAREALRDVERSVRQKTELSLSTVRAAADGALSDAEHQTPPSIDDGDLVTRRLLLEQRVEDAAGREREKLTDLTERLQGVLAGNGNGGLSPAELAEMLDEEVLALRERAARDFELTQLGMATEVITHELDVAIRSIRDALRRLRAWADVNDGLGQVHRDLRTAFDHLDSYLSVFAPLQRRLNRRRESVRGHEISAFLQSLFTRHLGDGEVALQTTPAFDDWSADAFRSTLYPVFVNLVDNALYWTGQARPPRWIRLDAEPDGTLVLSDSGPGIPERDASIVFEYGFTRKPGGRGAGLHISREVLRRDGWDIELRRDPGTDKTAFAITGPGG